MPEDKDPKDPDKEKPQKSFVAKTPVDLQRLKLEKLMKNPEKPVIIPERPKPKGTGSVPEFVRNVMGSSAGAGSGEFHVYRHLRRKEYSRQKCIQEKGKRELLDEEYHKKLEENKKQAEELTAKKRAKRLKKKQKYKQNKRIKIKDEIKSEKADTESGTSEDEDVTMEEPLQGSDKNNESEVTESLSVQESVLENSKSDQKDCSEMNTDLNSSNKEEDKNNSVQKVVEPLQESSQESKDNHKDEAVDSLNVKKIVLDDSSKSDQKGCGESKEDSNSIIKKDEKDTDQKIVTEEIVKDDSDIEMKNNEEEVKNA